ncbi:MAG: energy transducer TonB, partial [Acidobacteriota bacterium]
VPRAARARRSVGVKRAAAIVGAILLGTALPALAQPVAAELTKYQEPAYPDAILKAQLQGNVNLVARIDKEGKIQNLLPLASSFQPLIDPAIAAVEKWRFKPATRDGKPVDIAANIGVRFRLKAEERGAKPQPIRGALPQPILGDLPIFPADATGRKTGPEGFPIRLGFDPKLRAEAVLDVDPQPKARKMKVRVEATSPLGRPYILFDNTVAVPANAADVKIPVVAAVAADWPEGVWIMRFSADTKEAGGGQFWVARDPNRFDFTTKPRQKS